MDSEILQQFIRQTESRLSAIRGSILFCLQDGASCGELSGSLQQARLIKDSAGELKFPEIVNYAGKLEKRLEPLIADKSSLSDALSRKLLDYLAVLEAHLTQITFRADFFPDDIAGFIEESFENLQIKLTPEAETTEVVEEEKEFEIDEEMLEVFAAEAEELLQNINTHLKFLEENPNDREALTEIRRSAHTLKGSAGIIGLKKLSDLAHRVEDLLDYLAENELEADAKIFELLLASTDCFGALASGENSSQLAKKIARLYGSFDEVFESLKNKKIPETSNSKFEILDQTVCEQKNNKTEAAEIRPAVSQTEISNSKSVVRVSLEKLDEIIKLVGDLTVSRSIFERLLSELARENEELRSNTKRLQRSTDRLESEFEGDAMQAANLKFKIQDSRFSDGGSKREEDTQVSFFSSEFDTLEFDRYTNFHQTSRELVETAADNYVINAGLDSIKDRLEILFDSQRRLIEETQEKLLRLRLVRFGLLSPRLQRAVRLACDEEAKLADLSIEGENQEFDTQILDSLVEPLLHLLRNAVAHGIETPETRRLLGKDERGKIFLRVQSEGTHLSLTVSDDGRGISAAALIENAVRNNFITPAEAEKMNEEEAFALMFLPGLTTAGKLSQVAGRGIGMNVVKTSIERRQGAIFVNSEIQKGSTFTVRLPLLLALTRALIVRTSGQTFAFPSKLVKQVKEIAQKNDEKAARPRSAQFDNENYPAFPLREILGLPQTVKSSERAPVLLLEIAENPFVLIVDEIIGIEEIVIKPLGAPLENTPEFLGAAILGDGAVVPVLDLVYLLKKGDKSLNPKVLTSNSRVLNQPQDENSLIETKSEIQNPKSKIVLVVDDSPTVRQLTSNLIKTAGWQPVIAKDGLEALEILQASQQSPDVILTDVEMPRMNGYELLSVLKKEKNLRGIPVVMITSRAGEKHRQEAFKLGVSEYLTKPFEDALLIEIVRRLTEIKK